MADYPEPHEADPDSVVTALEVGASMWSRGEQAEAMKWLRKAVDEAFDAGLDDRGLELSKSAAALTSLLPPPPSARPPATTAAPPPVSTTAAPPPVSTAAAPPPVSTTAAPPPITASEPDIERISPDPDSIAPPPRVATAKPPPPPRATSARIPTSRNRASRPPALTRGITSRPLPRVARADETAARAPSEAKLPSAPEAKHDDISTRVTVPSESPAKYDALAKEEADPAKRETRPVALEQSAEQPRFDRKFLTPLAVRRTATPPRPVSAPIIADDSVERAIDALGESAPPPVLSEPPEGATRPAISEESLAALEHGASHERKFAPRESWTTTGAVRVAVSREGSRVIVRPYDGGALLEGEAEALLVATPDAERVFKMLEVEGPSRT